MSIEILAGLVQAAGHQIPISQFIGRAKAAELALMEEDDYTNTTGKEAPSLMSKSFIDMMNNAPWIVGRPDRQWAHGYSEEEYEAQRVRNEKYAAFAPIGKALLEYSSIAQLAARHDMMLKTPLFEDSNQNQIVNPKYVRGLSQDELVLFRITAAELGRSTFRPTVAGCLELAREPATVALREQIAEWQAELVAGNESALRSIQSEVKQASASLSKLAGVQTAGTITTWLSVPASLVELMLSLPPFLGISIGIAGKIASAKTMAVTRKCKWATYGSA